MTTLAELIESARGGCQAPPAARTPTARCTCTRAARIRAKLNAVLDPEVAQ